jgi:NADPH:quinone reductase-like Zn-dependent oxidoreductase
MLNPDGKYVMVGGALPQIFKSILFGWALSLGSRKIRFLTAKALQKDLELIVSLVNEGKIKPVIDRKFPLDKTAEAFRYLVAGHARGKVVITV